jgi:hypothetical protein
MAGRKWTIPDLLNHLAFEHDPPVKGLGFYSTREPLLKIHGDHHRARPVDAMTLLTTHCSLGIDVHYEMLPGAKKPTKTKLAEVRDRAAVAETRDDLAKLLAELDGPQ